MYAVKLFFVHAAYSERSNSYKEETTVLPVIKIFHLNLKHFKYFKVSLIFLLDLLSNADQE